MFLSKFYGHSVPARSLQVLVLGALLVPAFSFGQTTSADLAGTIYDTSGATVPGAVVVATNQATGVASTTASTGSGEYRIQQLLIGKYTLSVTAAGFARAQEKDIQVVLNQVSTVNVTLQVGNVAGTVEVSSAAVTIDTETAQITGSFESRQLTDLPMASTGSGVINLALLQAGVASGGSVGIGMGPSVGGQRPANNNFTVEGIDNNNRSTTGPVSTIPNDAVAEFTVLQNQFSAEFGHSSGGQFNQVLKTGTNTFHGELYEYFENRNLNAADNLNAVDDNPLHPRFDSNRFGGNFGGPVLKDRLFFFADYEYNPIGSVSSGGLVYAPTAAAYSTLAAIPGISQSNLGILQKYLGTAATASPGATVGFGAYPTVGSGNEAAGLQSGNAISIPLGQITTASPSFSNTEAAVTTVDYNISQKDNLRGRFALNRSGSIDASGYPASFYQINPNNSYLATLSEFHNFTPALINEFRFGYNRNNSFFGYPSTTFPGLDVFPNITIYELNVNIGPDPNAPQGGVQNIYEMTDNVSYNRGRHTFKFGFDGANSISPQTFTQRSRGDYEWSYLSDYLFDYYPDYLAQRNVGGRTYYGNNQLFAFYGNDSWKMRPNLTINIGLRYEYQTIPLGERQQDLNVAANVPGLISFNAPQPQKTNFMPRVGVAYSPGTSGKTSIRAGFGINYDVNRDNLGLDAAVPQFSSTIDVTGGMGTGFLAGGGISPKSVPANPSIADLRAETGGVLPVNAQRPESLQWNMGVQHVFAQNYTVDLTYLGTRGLHLTVQDQLNRQPVVNASNALPVFTSMPSQSTLDGLPNTLTGLSSSYASGGDIVPSYLNAGFTGILTSFQQWGSSTYNGLAFQVTRRFTNGLQFLGSYTWSHNIDNSTADVFSTYTTPRRPQDARDLGPDKSNSALDHRQRLTFESIYDLPYFSRSSHWLVKNLVGNWEFTPVYTYQTGTYATAQAGVDANLNGDSAGDRAIVNPSGNPNVGSGTTALTNTAGATVGYLINNPAAGYIATPKGALSNAGRNTLMLEPIDDVDLSLIKRFTITEHSRLEFAMRATNVLNHAQYTGGFLSDVAASVQTGANVHQALIPSSPLFGQWNQVFSSNPRSLQLSAKFYF